MAVNRTLREKVYEYLRQKLASGALAPGSYIDQNEICRTLGISRAPLRDALIQLETEGFVNILPRKGVLISKLTLEDIRNTYKVIGCLESSVILDEFERFMPVHIDRMEQYNARLKAALGENRFDEYYELNLGFHEVFLELSDNALLKRLIMPLKQRLYDFPRMKYDVKWERINLAEHRRFLDSVKFGNREAAASIVKNEHWSFEVHRDYLTRVYRLD